MTGSGVEIRDATAADWPAIWAFMEPIVREGETFSWYRDLDEGRAREAWMRPAPGATLVAQEPDGRIVGTAEMAPNHVPEGFRHPSRGYVGLHIMYRAL